jgi:hypothetical protein
MASSAASSTITEAHPAPHREDAVQGEQVHHADQVEEQSRHAGAEEPERVMGRRAGTRQRGDDARPDGDEHRQGQDHGGIPEGEEEPARDGALPVGGELPGGVVDRGDMIGVEGVPQPEGVGGYAEWYHSA